MRNLLTLLITSAFIFCSCDFKHSHLDSIPFKGIHKITDVEVNVGDSRGVYHFKFYDVTHNRHESVTFTSPKNVRLYDEGPFKGCKECGAYVNVMTDLINIGMGSPDDTITVDFTNSKVYHKGLDTRSLSYILGMKNNFINK